MDNIYFPTESLAELLGSLPEADRLPRLLQSLGRLEAGGMPRKSVRAVERQLRQVSAWRATAPWTASRISS
jgi:hypothetical protein